MALLALLLVLLLAGVCWSSAGAVDAIPADALCAWTALEELRTTAFPAVAVPVAAALAALASMATPAELVPVPVPVPVPPSVELPAPIGIAPDCAAPMTVEAAWSAREVPPLVAADPAATARRARLAGPLFETGVVARFAVAGVVLFADV